MFGKSEDILKENDGKKFDVVLMNPPYGDVSNGGMFLDMQFVEKVNKIANKQIVVHPANRWISNTKIGKSNAESHHLKELDIEDGNKVFNISTSWKWVGIYIYDNTTEYNQTLIKFNNEEENIDLSYDNRCEFFKNIEFNKDFIKVINNKKKLYNELVEKNKTMINDTDSWIYEENRLQRGKKFGVTKSDQQSLSRVKEYLKTGKYKYCIYTGSYNNLHNKISEWNGENPDKIFKGQVCWLTNKENIKNNIKYWMDCTLFDIWRIYKFGPGGPANCCKYGFIPALNFDKSEKEFKEYVDSLNKFNKDEIKVLKEYNIHNADKL